jgi:hypothetical protein
MRAMTPSLHLVKESVDTMAASVAENLHRVGENLHTAKQAVAQDLRALWSGMEQLQGLSAANDPPAAQDESASAAERRWRVPVGWISLVAAGVFLLGLGLAQITLVEVARKDAASQKRSGHSKRALKRVRPPNRTDWSREG